MRQADLQRRRTVEWAALRRTVFSDAEWARVRDAEDPDLACLAAWTRKEATVKATGHGLAMPLRQVVVSRPAAARTEAGEGARWRVELPVGIANGADLWLAEGTDDGYAAAVAVLTGRASGTAPGPGVQEFRTNLLG
jgi:4'-phosphopantetheinyl transferase